MPNKLYPSDVAEQAQIVLDQWKQIDPALKVGDLTQAMLQANLDKLLPLQSRLTALEAEEIDVRNQRAAICTEVWDQIKRARGGVKAIYGDDSSQYKMMGGIPRSERKKPVRKTAASKPE